MKLKNAETSYQFADYASGSAASVEIVLRGEQVVQVLCSSGVSLSDLKRAVNQLSGSLAPKGRARDIDYSDVPCEGCANVKCTCNSDDYYPSES